MKKLLHLLIFVSLLLGVLVSCNNICDHVWEITTTAPTCFEIGYDTMTCGLCGEIKKTNETAQLDHNYSEIYSFDDTDHWYACSLCGTEKDKANHTADDEGVCTVCQVPTSVTPGIIYGVSEDGTYAEVLGYEGTAAKIRIAKEYNGLPVKNIQDYAFAGNQIITSVAIPDSLTRIGDSAFLRCSSLISVVIPDSVTTVKEAAFSICKSLTSVVIGNGVSYISYDTFFNCSSLTSVVIGDNVTSIGKAAFRNCTGLVSIILPDGVETIGELAFEGCSSLHTIVIPDDVRHVGYDAFNKCEKYAHVYYAGSYTDWTNITFVGENFTQYTTFHYDYVPKV